MFITSAYFPFLGSAEVLETDVAAVFAGASSVFSVFVRFVFI